MKREDTVQRTTAGGQNTARQVERVNPGDPGSGLQVTEQAIDIVRAGSSGVAQEQTISTVGSDGRMNVVSVDIGKSDKPVAVQVDTSSKPKKAK